MQWKWQKFEEISGAEMHEILSVRQRVFIIEQQCFYLDADDLDSHSIHLTGRSRDGDLCAYARITLPGSRFVEPSIGRVLITREFRGKGYAREVVLRAIEKVKNVYSGARIKISAQLYLVNFYESVGFQQAGEPYDEDGIEHIDMFLEELK